MWILSADGWARKRSEPLAELTMAVAYTRRLVTLRQTAPFTGVVLAGRPGRTLILRDISVWTFPASARVQLYIVSPGGAYFHIVYQAAGSSQITHYDLRQAMHEGDELTASSDASELQIGITGYDLAA